MSKANSVCDENGPCDCSPSSTGSSTIEAISSPSLSSSSQASSTFDGFPSSSSSDYDDNNNKCTSRFFCCDKFEQHIYSSSS